MLGSAAMECVSSVFFAGIVARHTDIRFRIERIGLVLGADTRRGARCREHITKFFGSRWAFHGDDTTATMRCNTKFIRFFSLSFEFSLPGNISILAFLCGIILILVITLIVTVVVCYSKRRTRHQILDDKRNGKRWITIAPDASGALMTNLKRGTDFF